jgi:phosphatidylserine/phosphatidylglycerophosphate/cardiolipin synthase-like enzyme
VRFLAEGEQTAQDVIGWLREFCAAAHRSLDFAMYDFRLSDPPRAALLEVLRERARAGVAVRIVYDADKPQRPTLMLGHDPAPSGSGAFVQSLGFPWRRIGGTQLMHHKYVLRDAGTPEAHIWTGSTNLTDDACTLEENNIVELASPALAASYARDFEQLWSRGAIENTGAFVADPVTLTIDGAAAQARVLFSPGEGHLIDDEVARLVASARQRVVICSMLLNAGRLIAALGDVLAAGQVHVSGIYDRTQMEEVFVQWQEVPHNHWKIPAVQEIIAQASLVGKRSTPYSPTSRHDFMHNKVLIVDDTVITGSYNFSRNAELNAENILIIHSAPLAERYIGYTRHLMRKYGSIAQG